MEATKAIQVVTTKDTQEAIRKTGVGNLAMYNIINDVVTLWILFVLHYLISCIFSI